MLDMLDDDDIDDFDGVDESDRIVIIRRLYQHEIDELRAEKIYDPTKHCYAGVTLDGRVTEYFCHGWNYALVHAFVNGLQPITAH